jgi:hypothetical protein
MNPSLLQPEASNLPRTQSPPKVEASALPRTLRLLFSWSPRKSPLNLNKPLPQLRGPGMR